MPAQHVFALVPEPPPETFPAGELHPRAFAVGHTFGNPHVAETVSLVATRFAVTHSFGANRLSPRSLVELETTTFDVDHSFGAPTLS